MTETALRTDVRAAVAAIGPGVIALRRRLHQHPELAFEETWTAATLAARMRGLGLAVQERIGGTGVLAVLDGGIPGKTLLVRADIDALPIAETTDRPYASRIANRTHACGHDAHAAIVAGVAEVLVGQRKNVAGRVAFVFQPADEPMLGAKRMIDDGLFDRIAPDMSLGVHVLPMARVGQAVVQTGPIWASRDELVLSIDGSQTPASEDVVRVAARVASALYEVVEREGRTAEPVTFRVRSLAAEQEGTVWLGGAHDRPTRAVMELNLALYDNVLRETLLARIEDVAGDITRAAGHKLSVERRYALPALVNDVHVTAAVERAAAHVIGPASIVRNWRNPFSDDFGLFMAEAPGTLMLLGTGNPDKGIIEIWHRSGFDIDEDALPVGVEILSLAALDLLRPRAL